ncbi:restriction endonuclease subunit S [Streptomyces sp. NBC_01450]|uniref:restriction endonuclease subunit S n=1 Tax=Streptomyces sp. NBC_01450 TaxID=2903871 RepID=UPI002E33EB90|nr:restriction endonuclease subunit S [Streptomyces sp. NBC_01450]
MTLGLGLGSDSGDGGEELPGRVGGELPGGWVRATLGELGVEVQPGFASGKHNRDGDGIVHLRPMNITRNGVIDLSDARYVNDESDRRVEYGDVLFNNTNSPALVGKTAWVDSLEPVAFSNHMTRLRGPEGLDSKFLARQLHHFWSTGYFKTVLNNHVNQASVSRRVLLDTEIVVPPLAEQLHIVAEIDLQISHIEAGEEALQVGLQKVDEFRKSVICSAIPTPLPDDWSEVTVEEAGKIDLGRQRHPSWHTGPEMKPYLRVANVFEDRIDISDVKAMDFSDTGDRYTLKDGDVLLNEGQSPHLLGRPAIYRGIPEGAAFQNTLLRFRPNSWVTSEWALLVFRRHMHTGRFTKESRITTNIAHLSAARLKTVEFPYPPVDKQEMIVKQVRRQLEDADRMDAELRIVTTGSGELRAALLHAAFTGALVPQDPADEPASALLDRIRAARATAKAAPRKRTTRKPRPAPPGQGELPE